jgi:hypothetical protein
MAATTTYEIKSGLLNKNMMICICGVGIIWLTRRRLWISGHLLLDLGENREELGGSLEIFLRESTVAKLQLYYFRIRPLHRQEIMAPRRGRKEELPLTFKYCMIDNLVWQRRNDDVRRRPRTPSVLEYSRILSRLATI